MFFKKMSLPHQLSWGALFAILITTSVLLFSTTKIFNTVLNKVDQEHLFVESNLLAKQLESAYYRTVDLTDSYSNLFISQFSSLAIDDTKTMKVDRHDSSIAYLDGEVLNLNYKKVDEFTKATKAAATVFIRNGDDFLRITTSLKKENGDRAIGTYLGKKHPGYHALLSGNTFEGSASLFGKNYLTKYVPIQKQGRTIAIIFIGVSYDHILGDISKAVGDLKFGKSGYLFIVDNKKNEGNLLLHPTQVGKNVYSLLPEFKTQFQQIYQEEQGSFYYTSKISGVDNRTRESKVNFHQVKGWNWVVVMKSYTDDFQETIMDAIFDLSIISLIGATILSLFLWFIIRFSLKPLAEITDSLHHFGAGDLTFKFNSPEIKNSRNEVDILKKDVIAMRDNLVTVIQQILNSSTLLSKASVSISEANTHLKEQAKTSGDECLQVASSIEQMTVSIEQVANSTVEVSQESIHAKMIVQEGNTSITHAEETIGALASAFKEASATIKDVELSSKNIGDVVTVINAIAEQTNLLALNAAIEAARAGEQGRGFAVVADEVRVLAQRTQQSTEEIQNVVDQLQKNSLIAVAEMDQGTQKVSQSVETVCQSREIIDQILNSITAVGDRIAMVASTAEEQSVATMQIRESSHSLKESANITFELAEQSQLHSDNTFALAKQLQKDLAIFKLH
ncbi:methyl-accepting chemotaxis protein [Marinomonas algicola]|uniref:methyl-accepting chemotaxis protein n=1 Tax=Marinomonas algicola TaxID=2773454 RepID=UPI001749DEC4|nr:methyl-accepting chemotaxis protein [Marinomonas algicola]